MESWNEKLLSAVKADNITVVEACLGLGADVNCKGSEHGNTPLHLASTEGRTETASFLITHGAIVDIQNYDGQTPLQLATYNGHTKTAGFLINNGANLDLQDKWGNTLYDVAKSEEIKELLKTAKESTQLGIPRELIQLGKQAVNIYTDLLKEDSYELFELRSMLQGEQGTGKSTIARFLVGKKPKKSRRSTDGIELYTGVSFFDDDTEEWIGGKQDFTIEDITVSRSIKSFQHQRPQINIPEHTNIKKHAQLPASLDTTHTDERRKHGHADWSQREDDVEMYEKAGYLPLLPTNIHHGEVFETNVLHSPKGTLEKFGIEDSLVPEDKCQSLKAKSKAHDYKSKEIFEKRSDIALHKQEHMFKKEDLTHKLTDEVLSSNIDKVYDQGVQNKLDDCIDFEMIQNTGIIEKLKSFLGVKKEVKEIKISITKAKFFNKSKDVAKKKFHKRKVVPVTIWDFGGQDVFYSTHQTFLTYRAVYMLVLDGSRTMNEPCKNEQFLPGNTGVKTQKDYVRFWINTIITYCKGDILGFPKIMVILTHKDKLSVTEINTRRSELFSEIERMFEGSPIEQHLVIKDRIFVNARNSKDPEMELIKKSLIQLARIQPTWGQKLPKCFLPLELEIQYLAKQGVTLIHIEHMNKINSQQAVRPLTDSELKVFLKFQHSVGKILYFDEPYLDKHIIISPTYLIDAFKSIITDHQFCKENAQKEEAWHSMNKKGVILKQTVETIWKQKEYAHFYKSIGYLLRIMTHLDILVEPLRYDSTHNRKATEFYYVASMIRKLDTTGYLQSPTFSQRNIALSFDTSSSIIPPALSFRFLSYCLSIWGVRTYGDQNEDMLFHRSAVFKIDPSLDMHIQCEDEKLIVRLVHARNRTLIMKDLASSIRECLFAALHKISQLYIKTSSERDENIRSFDVKVCCSSSMEPCSIAIHDIDYVWICPQHKIEHRKDMVLSWFTEKGKDVCELFCPVTDEQFLLQSPTDLHLRRLALEYDIDEIRELVIQLGLPISTWKKMYDSRFTEIIGFEALQKCLQMTSFTFKDLKIAAEKQGIQSPHTICKVLRDRHISFDIDPEKWDLTPNDEDIDKLAPFVGGSSLAFLVELALTFQDWEQIKYSQTEPDLVKLNRKIMEVWRTNCKDHNIKPTLRTLGQAFGNIGKHIKIIENLLFN